MIGLEKDASEPERVKLCDGTDPAEAYCRCPWGAFWRVTIYANGFPHRHILRRNRELLQQQVQAWKESPDLEWSAA